MPRRVNSDVHEWINEVPTVPGRCPVNPHNQANSPGTPSGERRPCGALLQPVAGVWSRMRSVGRSRRSRPCGGGGGANETLPFRDWIPNRGLTPGTTAGGQFGWGGTSLKRYQGCPKVSSGGSELRRRGQG